MYSLPLFVPAFLRWMYVIDYTFIMRTNSAFVDRESIYVELESVRSHMFDSCRICRKKKTKTVCVILIIKVLIDESMLLYYMDKNFFTNFMNQIMCSRTFSGKRTFFLIFWNNVNWYFYYRFIIRWKYCVKILSW